MNLNTVKLGDFFQKRGQSVNPLKHPGETFELYSIPAYDKQKADILPGNEIGSSKKLLSPKDVIISRIVPHIRRCWIVPNNTGLRQIGSGEWIIFRSDDVYPSYLRYYLMSDTFNKKFMSTIKGVGGSLLRADPKQVAKFDIPLPPLPTQKKIAAILDAADELRQKDKELIVKYDELAQSLFADMFGDPVSNPKQWLKHNFTYFADIDTQMITDFELYANVPHIGIANIEKNTGKLIGYKLVKEDNLISGKYIFTSKHIILSKIRPNLNKVALPNFEGLSSADSYPILVNEDQTNRIFFAYLLRSNDFLNFISQFSQRTNIPKINKNQLLQYECIAPPVELQNRFADRFMMIENQKQQTEANLKKSEELFQSLLQRAFKGELVS